MTNTNQPDWALVNKVGDSRTYVDLASLQQAGSLVMATVRYALNPPGEDKRNGKPVKEMLMQEEYDTRAGRLRVHRILFTYTDGTPSAPLSTEPAWCAATAGNLKTLQFLRGLGTTVTEKQKAKWWQFGKVKFCDCTLEKGYEAYKKRNYKTAFQCFQTLSERNDMNAQYFLAGMYVNELGVKQDLSKAFYWFKRSADLGEPRAQYAVAGVYYEGVSPIDKPDLKEAMNWYKKSADQGYADAQYQLGFMFYKGQGVETNLEKSIFWFKKAASGGNKNAINALKAIE